MTAAARTQVFVSYSHRDAPWLKRLQVHLKPLAREGAIELWDDTRIKPGAEWRLEIEQALARAGVAVLLVSADFLASDFIADNELPPLLESASRGGVRIMPVLVGPSSFSTHKELSKYQAVNPPSRPLGAMKRHEAEEVLVKLAQAIAGHLAGAPAPSIPATQPPANAPLPPPAPLPTGQVTRRELLGAALDLDRAQQWIDLEDGCRDDRHRYFLLHGTRRQSLGLFCERVRRRIGERTRPHLVADLRYRQDFSYPESSGEWLLRLRSALADRGGGRGDAAALLVEALRKSAVFLLIEIPYNYEFNLGHQEGIRELVAVTLPAMLAGPRQKNPLRLLVSIDEPAGPAPGVPPRRDLLDRQLSAVRAAGQIDYVHLTEAQMPSRADVIGYLKRQKINGEPLREDGHEFKAVLAAYDDFERANDASFDQLVRILDDVIHV